MSDYPQVVEAALIAAGGWVLSNAEAEQVLAWEDAGLPVSVVVRGIETCAQRRADRAARAARTGQPLKGRFRMTWAVSDVLEQADSWARSVGPASAVRVNADVLR